MSTKVTIFFQLKNIFHKTFYIDAYKKKSRYSKEYRLYKNCSAEAGGFEPPVRLPVRQFSKLVVSATHPHFQSGQLY